MKRLLTSAILAAGLFGTAASVVHACPMCKYANESDQNDEIANMRPKAYMYSILFMISMPATIFTVFGVSFYRMSKQAQASNPTEEMPDDSQPLE